MFPIKRKYDTITLPSNTDLDEQTQQPTLESLIAKHVDTTFRIGKYYLLKNDKENAIKYFTKGVTYDCVKSINELAKIFATTDKNRAIELYEKGIECKDGLCANNLGYLYFSDKKPTEDGQPLRLPNYILAKKYFAKAIELGHSVAHYNYAYVCHKHLAKYDEAGKHYELFLPHANAEHHYRFYGMFLRDIDKNQEKAVEMFAKGLCLSRNGMTYKYRILEHSDKEQVLIYEELQKTNKNAVVMEILCTMPAVIKHEFSQKNKELKANIPSASTFSFGMPVSMQHNDTFGSGLFSSIK